MNMNNATGSLRLPLQTAPIDRSPSAAALSGSGVEASFDFGDILSGLAQQAVPALVQAAPGIISGLLSAI
jgi:hypothetical protein